MVRRLYLGLGLMLLAFAMLAGAIRVQAETQQESELVSVTVTTYFDELNQDSVVIDDQYYGSILSFETDLTSDSNYSFAYWIVNGVVYEDLPIDHEFMLIDDMSLTAVFYPINPTIKYAVLFMDTNGENLDIQYVESGQGATPPTEGLPDKPGYVVSPTEPWSVNTESVTGNVVSVLQYDLNTAATYTVSVSGGTVNSQASDTFAYNEIATVIADAPGSGEYFHHWEVENHLVSYQSTYSFTVLENVSLSAVYSTVAPDDEPMITLSDNLGLRTGYNSYLGQFYLPSGYQVVEVGVLSSESEAYLDLADDGLAGVHRNKIETWNGTTKEFVASITSANAVSVRAYMVCKDELGDLVTVYDQPAYNVYNGGFETGDLSGWDAYSIWKDESGMMAFIDDRVTDGTYFSAYPYDRDGTYNIGITGETLTWDQSSERMGHLRSSDFTLGGSGWISFKLGGGKTSSVAYVSVHRTSDNMEVARFSNRHFNDTAVATTQYGSAITNAEAFLYQYYFDLGAVGTIGEKYYFLVTEASSYDWAILSCDSFVSHYEEAATPTADELATNIVPTIQNISGATNQIVNGYFDSNFDDWDNVDASWKIDSGQARSNPTGDSDLGVIRSSAFTLDGTDQYLRFSWAGGLKYDKQIFLSIKEVGTNIEVMRIVRRDSLSGKESEGFDNHMVDLSGLDTSKLYYLEFVDNRSGGWGISYVDEIRLIDQTEWDGVIVPHPGDEAVYITPLEIAFIYIK